MSLARPVQALLGAALGLALGVLVIVAHEAAHFLAFLALGVPPAAVSLWPPAVLLPTWELAAMAPLPRAFATLVGPVVGALVCIALVAWMRAHRTLPRAVASVPITLLLLAQTVLTLDPNDLRNDGGAAAQDVGPVPVTALAVAGALVGGALLVLALAGVRRAWMAAGPAERPERGSVPANVQRAR